MTFNDLLCAELGSSELSQTLLLRHTPWEGELRKKMPEIAATRDDLFNAYQQCQGERAEPRMAKAKYVASFVGYSHAMETVFVGIYENRAMTPISREEFWGINENAELRKLGMVGFKDGDARSKVLRFDLAPTRIYAHRKGRLFVGWPRNLARVPPPFADRVVLPITDVRVDSVLGIPRRDWPPREIDAPELECLLPEELVTARPLVEGAPRQIMVNAYERNPRARDACIEEHGVDCSVCGFNFLDTYGEIGDGYIHVHHLRDLATIGKEYVVDPIGDLRPVCPNCHAMLHRHSAPARTIEALRAVVTNRRV